MKNHISFCVNNSKRLTFCFVNELQDVLRFLFTSTKGTSSKKYYFKYTLSSFRSPLYQLVYDLHPLSTHFVYIG